MTDTNRAPDAYEAEYMQGDDALHREKLTFPTWFRWFLGLAVAGVPGFALAQALAAGDMTAVAILAAAVPVMLFFVLMLSALRVTVTPDHVRVQYGPIGPKIPIERIEHCEAEDYELWRYGGYGIRYSVIEGAWCYNMVGDNGKAVRIHYRTESGALRKVLVASRHHHALADAINRARIAKGHDVPDHLAPDDTALGLDKEVIFSEEIAASAEAAHEAEESVASRS